MSCLKSIFCCFFRKQEHFLLEDDWDSALQYSSTSTTERNQEIFKRYSNGSHISLETATKILNEVNKHNDTSKLLDLHCQFVGNAKYYVKQKIKELERGGSGLKTSVPPKGAKGGKKRARPK